ncbi:sulfotransferase family protein [Desulfopila inferna]|uniref:sulfotransferase family protein n=1 Tax=Desulfopila inferna TaxID=468528 RepID=UPI001964ED99|nr:sulfotransferase [Desulfopila inferna]MBM9605761.1 sulfotransferase [Desulfopila inferna]
MAMNPIFLVGAERSGTTLLRLMLNGHPDISWLNEFEYAVDLITEDERLPNVEHYIYYLSTNRIFQASGLKMDKSSEYLEIVKSFLAQKQELDNKSIIGATCHRHYDRLLRVFPQARFIYLFRDPRDVARSNIGMGWAGNVWNGVDRWVEAERLWERVKQVLEINAFIEIKSEELILSPKETLSTICSFLDVQYDGKMMSYPDHTSYSLPDPRLTQQWRRKMSERQIKLVESKVFERMTARGYLPCFRTKNEPFCMLKIFLQIQNWIFRKNFRFRRYGFRLTAGYFLAKKLRLESSERKIKLLLNERTRKYLK